MRGKLCRLPQVQFQQAHLLRNTKHQRQAVPGKRLIRSRAGERRQGKELCGVSERENRQSQIETCRRYDIVNIGLHFFHKDVRLYAASCSEV